jgi:glutathione peroxidase-family protein
MLAHKMIINDSYNFIAQHNLPQEFKGMPLEVIVLPLQNIQTQTISKIESINKLSDFNDSIAFSIDSSIDISHLADEMNA